jgi:hypothetical protein
MKIWMENCPENFTDQYLLVAAEMARLSNDKLKEIVSIAPLLRQKKISLFKMKGSPTNWQLRFTSIGVKKKSRQYI